MNSVLYIQLFMKFSMTWLSLERRMVMRAKCKQFLLQRTPLLKTSKSLNKLDEIVLWMFGENVIFYLINVW